jgi:hypothetical protein
MASLIISTAQLAYRVWSTIVLAWVETTVNITTELLLFLGMEPAWTAKVSCERKLARRDRYFSHQQAFIYTDEELRGCLAVQQASGLPAPPDAATATTAGSPVQQQLAIAASPESDFNTENNGRR